MFYLHTIVQFVLPDFFNNALCLTSRCNHTQQKSWLAQFNSLLEQPGFSYDAAEEAVGFGSIALTTVSHK